MKTLSKKAITLNQDGIITASGVTVIETETEYLIGNNAVDKADTIREGDRIEQRRDDNHVASWAVVL